MVVIEAIDNTKVVQLGVCQVEEVTETGEIVKIYYIGTPDDIVSKFNKQTLRAVWRDLDSFLQGQKDIVIKPTDSSSLKNTPD